MSKRVCVVVNKWWELDPVLFCLTSKYLAAKLPMPLLNAHPRPRNNPQTAQPPKPVSPRAVFQIGGTDIEIWCISDLLEHLPDKGAFQSSSEKKAARIGEIFQQPADLTVAVGTASAGVDVSLNGSVVVGTKSFMHNSKPNGANPDSNWTAGKFDQIVNSTLTPEDFATVTSLEDPKTRQVSQTFMVPPNNPATPPSLTADYAAVALGNINVTDYREYDATDEETIAAFKKADPAAIFGSLETTHGVIRHFGSDRFMFVSGIVDRLLHFHEEVDPAPYAQNSAGAHNAGAYLAAALPALAQIA